MQKVDAQILKILSESKKSIWELLDAFDFNLREFICGLRRLHDAGLISADEEGFALTERGKNVLDPHITAFKLVKCRECLGKKFLLTDRLKEILEEFKEITKTRPQPTFDYFQGYMDEIDVISRVALMHYYNDLHNKDFVLIGDDDLLSIALSLTNLPSRICVLDIDERIGSYLTQLNKERGFDIEFRRYNVAEPLPDDLIRKFDVFSSEPLETISGLKAFIGRGVSCLGAGGVGYFGLTVAEASHEKWLKIEKMLANGNCVITDLIRGFSRYPMRYDDVNYETFIANLKFPAKENPGIHWYKSALIRFEILGEPKHIIDPKRKLKLEFIDRAEDITHISVNQCIENRDENGK
ncbi:MAG: bis-aminopropyl spermidine synthase family protein [Methanomassiliicoccales archaeon]|nr:bis-aminopropyl spermidine synthase family protein [Methanomassiliicoccales archaeon]